MKINKKKALIITIATAILMIIIEGVLLYLLKGKLSGENYQFIGVNYDSIMKGELLILVIIEITLMLTYFFKKYKLNNFICFIFLLANFLLISNNFYSYGNFINTCLLYVYTLCLKKYY